MRSKAQHNPNGMISDKTMRTAWFPVGEDIKKIVLDWLEELPTSDLGDGDDRMAAVAVALGGLLTIDKWLLSMANQPRVEKYACAVQCDNFIVSDNEA